MAMTEAQRAEHEAKLTAIYKKFFGYDRVKDEEAKTEIEAEAKKLAKELSKETMRLLALVIATDTATTI